MGIAFFLRACLAESFKPRGFLRTRMIYENDFDYLTIHFPRFGDQGDELKKQDFRTSGSCPANPGIGGLKCPLLSSPGVRICGLHYAAGRSRGNCPGCLGGRRRGGHPHRLPPWTFAARPACGDVQPAEADTWAGVTRTLSHLPWHAPPSTSSLASTTISE